jgi:hypothetical protein
MKERPNFALPVRPPIAGANLEELGVLRAVIQGRCVRE